MDAITQEFEVAAPVERAFTVWTTKAATWWPRDHTMGGDDHAEVVFEPGAGGRIYERTATGDELEWGEVVSWDPPRRVSYLWHLFFDRSEATQVVVSFAPTPDGGTRVTIEQSGFERLGEAGRRRRERTHSAWRHLTGLYREAL